MRNDDKMKSDILFLKPDKPGFKYYVRSVCTGTVIGVEGFDSLSQIYFDNMFRLLLGHLQVIKF
jgi:hypothetical protein